MTIILENSKGDILYKENGNDDDFFVHSTSIPTSSIKSGAKSTKGKIRKRKPIEQFLLYADEEEDAAWKERFNQMANYRFPPKIVYYPTTDELVYKNRKGTNKINIRDLDSRAVKAFLERYIDIGVEEEIKIPEKGPLQPIRPKKITVLEYYGMVKNYFKAFLKNDDRMTGSNVKSLVRDVMTTYILYGDIGVTYNDVTIDVIDGIYYDGNAFVYEPPM